MFSFDDGRNKLCCVAFREFLKSLALFSKPLVAGVHGAAVGLGVTMLPFFDMVFASDKATFYTPYAKLGQVPEGGHTDTAAHAGKCCGEYKCTCKLQGLFLYFLFSFCTHPVVRSFYLLATHWVSFFYGTQALTHIYSPHY